MKSRRGAFLFADRGHLPVAALRAHEVENFEEDYLLDGNEVVAKSTGISFQWYT